MSPSRGDARRDAEAELDRYLERLFPLCRSLTGRANRETLSILSEIVPIQVHEVLFGTKVYDWTVPHEWNIRDAWIADLKGHRIVDFRSSNLHVASYSIPVRACLNWDDLRPYLHRHPDEPTAVPYRTTYYERNWGFCVTQAQFAELERLGGPFDVVIDSVLESGSLTYGECLLTGASRQEVLLSFYICHPSMANDNLSGMLLTAFLARHLSQRRDRQWSYRIVFVPETLGAITYCHANEQAMKAIDIGLVITTVGGPGRIGYKRSWNFFHPINRLVARVCEDAQIEPIEYPFDIHGSDERQYSSQGFRINCVTIAKDWYYEYPQYHSSLDNLDFVRGAHIVETYEIYERLIDKLEERVVYRSAQPYCEVMLARHGVRMPIGGTQVPGRTEHSELDRMLWLLFSCDGTRSVEDIADELNVEMTALAGSAERLQKAGLLERI